MNTRYLVPPDAVLSVDSCIVSVRSARSGCDDDVIIAIKVPGYYMKTSRDFSGRDQIVIGFKAEKVVKDGAD